MSSRNDPVEEIVKYEGDTCVRASAGTGKTFLLVKKFVHLLCMKDEDGKYVKLENILAITFTDKAANEMRQRITDEIYKRIKQLKNEEGKESKSLAFHLLTARRLINKGYISTIHSFCARVLKENPLEAGLDPHFEIIDADRSSLMQTKALERFLLDKLRKGDSVAEDLVYRFGFDSDFGFESSLSSAIKSILPLVRSSGKYAGDRKSLLSEYDLKLNGGIGVLTTMKNEAVDALRTLGDLAKTEKQKSGLEKAADLVSTLTPKEDIRSQSGLAKATSLQGILKSMRFGTEESKAESTKAKEVVEGYRKLIVSSLALDTATKFVSMLGEFSDFMASKVKGRDKLDFDDLQEKTFELLSRNDSLKKHYRDLFSFVLVDEFQDIDGLQKKIIEELSPPGEGKLFIVGDAKQAIYGFRGGDLEVFDEIEEKIINGEGKRFVLKTNRRSSEGLVDFVNGFFAAHEESIFGEDDSCVAESKRSDNPPVEFFSVMSNGLNADERRFKEATMLAARIKSLTDSEGVNNGDIAILLKKFSALPIYEAALDLAGVTYTIHRGTGFYRSQEVADMISLLSFIDDTSDIVSWVGALRSPYSACSDKTILALRRDRNGKPIEPARYLRKSTEAAGIDDPLEQAKFVEFISWIRGLVDLKDRMTVSEIIEQCLEKSRITGILGAQPEGLQKVANLHKLIETARMMEQDSGTSLKNYVRHFKSLYDREGREASAVVVAEDDQNVKIMTLHQSKGLEFPIVFMPDISSRTGGVHGHVVYHKQKGLGVKYVDRKTLESDSGVVFENIKDKNKIGETEESKRLFYVGCTRAKDRLILSGNRGESIKNEPFLLDMETFYESNRHHFYTFDHGKDVAVKGMVEESSTAYAMLLDGQFKDSAIKVSEQLDPAVVKDSGREMSLGVHPLLVYQRCRREYILRELFRIPPDSSAPKGTAKKMPYSPSEVGSAVHATLERIDFNLPAENFVKVAEKSIGDRLPRATKKERVDIVARVKSLYSSELFEKLRNGELRETGREIPFAARFADGRDSYLLSGKIDLMVRDRDNRVTIVDYKYASGRENNESYRFQLEIYASAVARILGLDSISCAIIFFGGPGVKSVGWDMKRPSLAKAEKKILGVMDGIAELEKDVIGSDDRLQSDFPFSKGEDKSFVCPNRRCAYHQICKGSAVTKKN